MEFDEVAKIVGRLFLESQLVADSMNKRIKELQEKITKLETDKSTKK